MKVFICLFKSFMHGSAEWIVIKTLEKSTDTILSVVPSIFFQIRMSSLKQICVFIFISSFNTLIKLHGILKRFYIFTGVFLISVSSGLFERWDVGAIEEALSNPCLVKLGQTCRPATLFWFSFSSCFFAFWSQIWWELLLFLTFMSLS